jgi:hypothetical protein
VFVGGAVDFGRWYNARQHTIWAMDVAVLAGGRSLQLQNDDVDAAIAAAQAYYAESTKRRLKTIEETMVFKAIDNNTAFISEGNAYIETTFLRLANIDKLPLLATNGSEFARAELGVPGKSNIDLEISLVLDTTGSMQGQKLADLKVAAQGFIDMIVVPVTGAKPSKVAIVPYSSSVNVDSYASQVRGSQSPGTCTDVGCENYSFLNVFNQPVTLPVSNCATERTGANAYTDVAPSEDPFGWSYMPASNPCPANAILPLTSDADLLRSTIESLQAYGATGSHIGLGWGWYMLSPNFGYLWPESSQPATYGADNVKKIAIFMTDGETNTSYCNGVTSADSTHGSGNISDHINCNAPNGHSYTQALSQCTAMKAAGLTVYTVGFDVWDDQNARDLIEQCASDPTRVFLANGGEQLEQAFRAIGASLVPLHLSH